MDTFCLRSSPISDVTLPSTNSTMTATMSVELLEYCTVYNTFKTTHTPLNRGKQQLTLKSHWTVYSFDKFNTDSAAASGCK